MAAAPLVDFLVAGVQKGGTTALHSYLLEHPGLNMGRPKEVHFFDDEEVDWSCPDYGRYHAAFEAPAGRLSGEATPIYIYWPESLERAAAYNPRLKLVLIFRDPVARAWSHWRMEYARGAETEPFAWSIREGRERVAAAPGGVHRVHSYVERGFYGAQLQKLFGFFDQEQVLLLLSQELKERPDPTFRRVCRFLEIPEPIAEVRPRSVFEGQAMDYGQVLTQDDRRHLASVFSEDLRLFGALSGLSAPWLP